MHMLSLDSARHQRPTLCLLISVFIMILMSFLRLSSFLCGTVWQS